MKLILVFLFLFISGAQADDASLIENLELASMSIAAQDKVTAVTFLKDIQKETRELLKHGQKYINSPKVKLVNHKVVESIVKISLAEILMKSVKTEAALNQDLYALAYGQFKDLAFSNFDGKLPKIETEKSQRMCHQSSLGTLEYCQVEAAPKTNRL